MPGRREGSNLVGTSSEVTVKTIRDIMTPNPATCTPDTSLQEVARMMVDFDCGSIPVVRSDTDDTPIGTVTDRDIVCRLVAQGRNPLENDVSACMTTPCITVPVDSDVNAARDLMTKNQIRRLVVVDANGVCCGVVSMADIVMETGDTSIVREVSEPTEEPSRVAETKQREPV